MLRNETESRLIEYLKFDIIGFLTKCFELNNIMIFDSINNLSHEYKVMMYFWNQFYAIKEVVRGRNKKCKKQKQNKNYTMKLYFEKTILTDLLYSY